MESDYEDYIKTPTPEEPYEVPDTVEESAQNEIYQKLQIQLQPNETSSSGLPEIPEDKNVKNFERTLSDGMSNAYYAHPGTTDKRESYAKLNNDMRYEIFPAGAESIARLTDSKFSENESHPPYLALIPDDIDMNSNNYTSVNQLQSRSEGSNNSSKDFVCETSANSLPPYTNLGIGNGSQADGSDENTSYNRPYEISPNPINSAYTNLKEGVQSFDIKDEQSSHSEIEPFAENLINICANDDEYDTINDYEYISIDNQRVKYMRKQEARRLPPVPSEMNPEQAGVKQSKSVSRRKCVWIGGIAFGVVGVLVAVSVIAVIVHSGLGSPYPIVYNVNPFSAISLLDKPALLGTIISPSVYIYGISVIGSHIFIVQSHASQVVDVYDSERFTVKSNITIPESKSLQALVASTLGSNLFIVDFVLGVVHRHNLLTQASTKWPTGGGYIGLSITRSDTLVVTLVDNRQIIEYTPDGKVIMDIKLNSDIENPKHSVKLSSGRFAVTHQGTQHRVCIVDTSGQIVWSYGGSPGSGEGQLDKPGYLAVDRHDNLLVADERNNRVLLLSSTLIVLGNITIVDQHRLNQPRMLHLDVVNRRLFILESNRRISILGV